MCVHVKLPLFRRAGRRDFDGSGVAALALAISLAVAASARAAPVVFSEIMYHPVAQAGGITNADEYEFIELFNPTATNQPLSGAQFTAGISYTFTNGAALGPSQYVVVVKNREAFTNRYPGVLNLAASNYTGNLANDGEKVTLKAQDGTSLFSVTYQTAPPWPTWPDGGGSSLRLPDPGADASLGASWCAESRFNGTPGVGGECARRDVVVNETLAHTDPPQEDAVELFNTTTNAISVQGWYLSDSPSARKKYRITNSVIAANGYLVLYEYQFNTNVLFDTNNVPFQFSSSKPEGVYLTAADGASNLTRIVDIQRLEASANGVSFGLFPNGTGSWVTLDSVTLGTTNPPTLAAFRKGLGAPNSAPKVGPVVISEVMYHPANNSADEEYIELLNLTTNALPLALGTNGWKLATAVDFTFPPDAAIGPTQRVLAVGTTNVAAFRAGYGVPANVPVYSAWSGQLANSGESIRLYRPDTPNVDGFVPYILVDRVDYSDVAPWPTGPDGSGSSLERRAEGEFGNLAQNWFSGAPGGSPGRAPVGGFFNPQLQPAAPLAGQVVTVTVAVAAQTLPTQALLRVSSGSGIVDWILRDDGLAPDAVSNDQVYSAAIVAPTNQWLYYQFAAISNAVMLFCDPATERVFLPSPLLTVGNCGGAARLTVQPSNSWGSFEVSEPVSHASCFQIYLKASGEVLVDDVEMLDAGGTNHLRNSSFTTNLANWNVNAGNHSASTRDLLPDEGNNGVLHVRSTGEGNYTSFSDSVSASFGQSFTIGEPATLKFRARNASYDQSRWYAVAVGTPQPDVVMNEIMYHPAQSNEGPYEYVEIHNPGSASVDVTDWILEGVGGFRFPTGSVLGAGGYLVAAADSNTLVAAYGLTNVVGNWTGKLSNKGDRLRLRNAFGRIVDEVEYGDEVPWPVPADGYGPSLERINPLNPGGTSVNWMASSAPRGWQQVAWTGQVGAAAGGARFFLNFDGMCWIDDVSVKMVGMTNELVTNGGFESGTNGWTGYGNHALSRVVAGEGRGGGRALALYGTVSRWIPPDSESDVSERYGDPTNSYVGSAHFTTYAGSNYVVSWWVRREQRADQVTAVLGTSTNSIQLGSRGTPGAPNSVATTNTPIEVLWVKAATNLVAVSATNVVRAQVSPPGIISNVWLRYRVVGTNDYRFTDRKYSLVTMRDDGVSPDDLAGDGVFAAYAPVVTSGWKLVRFNVFAAASNGFSARLPQSDDPATDYGFWVQTGSPQTNIPNWNILLDGDPVTYPISAHACAISPDGQVFNDVIFRHRGHIPGDTNSAIRSGVSLRLFSGHYLDAWFAKNQDGINFRSRLNDYNSTFLRLVNEFLSYGIQRQLGFPTPRLRHVVLWINGEPSVTTELESPQDAFMADFGMSSSDFLSRSSYSQGRPMVGGDRAFDNFDAMYSGLNNATGATKNLTIQTNLWYEQVQQSVAFANLIGDADQHFAWNNFQYRRAADGRWTLFPWDIDVSLDTFVYSSTLNQTTNLHPYYQTPLHASIWDTNAWFLLGSSLFYPESGAGSDYTLPYRYRQQMTLWRAFHTWFKTNALDARVDEIESRLAPVFTQVGAGSSVQFLTNKTAEVRRFIASRRDFLQNGSWSDKNPDIWAATNIYNPSNVVISEIMYSPLFPGGDYLELHNTGHQPIDLSFWHIRSADETYNIPFGTMLAPTSYLVLARAASSLTNAISELSDPAQIVERYPGYRLWDSPLVFTTATEFASRVVEIGKLKLSSAGSTVQVLDNFSNLMDTVSYATNGGWPMAVGAALEVINPLTDNDTPTNWRASRIVGTPGGENTATADQDGDGMNDRWELRIVDASGGSLPNVAAVLPGADFDGDGIRNFDEFVLGTDPTVADRDAARLAITSTGAALRVEFGTMAATGVAYSIYSGRFYTLERATPWLDPWLAVTNYASLPGTGARVSYTNGAPVGREFYRYGVELRLIR